MLCEYCESNEVQGIIKKDGANGYVICGECRDYMENELLPLEDALVTAKARIIQLELEIASHESDGEAA